jgi:hypothetical protein
MTLCSSAALRMHLHMFQIFHRMQSSLLASHLIMAAALVEYSWVDVAFEWSLAGRHGGRLYLASLLYTLERDPVAHVTPGQQFLAVGLLQTSKISWEWYSINIRIFPSDIMHCLCLELKNPKNYDISEAGCVFVLKESRKGGREDSYSVGPFRWSQSSCPECRSIIPY